MSDKNWEEKSIILKDVFGLKGSPVAIKYSNTPAGNASKRRYRVCGAIPSSRSGEIINLSSETCSCPGGIFHLGLGLPREGLEKFLVYGEKLFSSIAIARRMREAADKEAKPPYGLSKYVVFSPLEKTEFEPDLVLFLCNAEQACRLVTLLGFSGEAMPKARLGGSLCWSTITYPLISGNINVSLGDISARRIEKYDPNELIVSVPINKIPLILESIDHCIAGKAKPSKEFEEIIQKIEEGKASIEDLRDLFE
ncbi:MAG: DUF169 domain-containing protein [Candidatus Hydrothermarchaeota archaeon]